MAEKKKHKGFAQKRSSVRAVSSVHPRLRMSLQPLDTEDTMEKLSGLKDRTKSVAVGRKLSALARILEELQLPIARPVTADEQSSRGWLDFEYTHQLFSSFFETSPTSVAFRDTLLDEDIGLPVLLYTRPTGEQLVILNDNGSVNMAGLLRHLCRQDDDRELFQTPAESPLSVDLVKRVIESMNDEYDRWVAKMLLCTDKSRARVYQLGIKPDRATKLLKSLKERLEEWENTKIAAYDMTDMRLRDRIKIFEERIKMTEHLIEQATGRCSAERVGDLQEQKDMLEESLENVRNLKGSKTPYYKQCFQQAVLRKANELAKEQRIKHRSLGAGPETKLDEEDEEWLTKCIEDKTTVHGRRHETVLYTHHRVKSRDLLRLANHRRLQRGAPLIRSVSTVTSRARPTNVRSIQAKRHKGKGLWCSKKPPKTEDRDNECTHHQRKHVALAKEHLFGKESEASRNHGLIISMDDKAYLRPGTSEGFTGARCQSVLQPTEESRTKKLPLHDFPEPSVYITPSAFRVIRKKPNDEAGKGNLISSRDFSMAVIHPKAYVGTNGTTWGSNLMRLRRECPDEFEVVPGADSTPYSKAVRKFCGWVSDSTFYFVDTTMKGDVMKVTKKPDCQFQKYECLRLQVLKRQCERAIEEWREEKAGLPGSEIAVGSEVLDTVQTIVGRAEELAAALSVSTGNPLWQRYCEFVETCSNFLQSLNRLRLPPPCPQLLELTDAGPGVGVSNFEVRFRAAERARVHSTDLLCRVHRAREDSGQNEAERLNASMGDALCDGGTIRWQYFSPLHGLTEEEVSTMSTSDLEAHRQKMMEKNAWAVAEEVKLRIDQSPAPSKGKTQAFLVEQPDQQFFYNRNYLLQYTKTAKSQRTSVPGHSYFKKIEEFVERHFKTGELYMEYVKGSCKDLSEEQELCDFCISHNFTGPPPSPVPRPYPDYGQLPDFHYLPYERTPLEGRPPDDYQPRAQLKAAINNNTVSIDNAESIHEFSQKYIVPEDKVKEYVEHINLVQTMKSKRAVLAENKRKACQEKMYEDYDWEGLYREGLLANLRVAELDKYLSHHNLLGKGKGKVKGRKVDMVRAHIGKTVCSRLLSDDSSDESEAEDVSSSESDSDMSDVEDEVVLQVGANASSDSDCDADEGQEIGTGTDEVVTVSRFGRRRQQKVLNPDYIWC
ncbi:uncharacterized protein LOC118425678 [Branchiostoma floridae]|uniref:Uncharacterized protein LOC118425678 n=1 Tax=Branchiostoma floridae TaxID=7739 RepID=C3Z499_BRAFL|nr:uncharacterized protein LOC118425678 [Branchiostoma floridae]|eukprot:XP_002596700.1 hypothetical protein BRAFLDRAFT_78402 [Branchiostoma floridae]